MTFGEFQLVCDANSPPASLDPLLLALWLDRNDKWDDAHTTVQSIPTPQGSLVHAYLHRKEGDLANAAYWYRRASREAPTATLDEEWAAIARELCSQDD